MSSHGTEKSWFEAAFDQARERTGAYAAAVGDWSEAHLPGGRLALWTLLGLLLLSLLLYATRPGEQIQKNGRGGFGGPMPVGVARVVRGDIAIKLNALGTVTPLATVTVRP